MIHCVELGPPSGNLRKLTSRATCTVAFETGQILSWTNGRNSNENKAGMAYCEIFHGMFLSV